MLQIQSLYICRNGEIELRTSDLKYAISDHLKANHLNLKRNNICLIEIGKDLDHFNLNDVISKQKLEDNLKKYIGDKKYKFIINFAVEESIVNKRLITFIKHILQISDNDLLTVTNNIEYISETNCVWYNSNEWVLDNIYNTHFCATIKQIRKTDLGTIKKKFLFLNNHFSKIRFDILKYIYKNNKHGDGNISFNLIDFSKPNEGIVSEEEFLKECKDNGVIYPSYYDTYPGLSQIGQEEISRNKILEINHIGTVSLNYRIYLEAFFEIITETTHLLKLSGAYTSEKIHKPLKAASPFIYYGKVSVKEHLEKAGFVFTSPIYFFGEGEEFMNHLDFLLNQDMNWYNKIQKQYLDEYVNNMMNYNSLQVKNSELIINFIYK